MHAVLLTLLFWAVAHTFIPRGAKETVTATTTITIQRPPPATPAPTPPRHRARVVVRHEAAPARAPLREAGENRPDSSPSLPRHPSTIPSKIERDQAGFAKEVAQLNKQNDPHAIPTIDPGSQESATKSYAFTVPSSLRGSERGNGIITPTQRWRDNGLNCYYGALRVHVSRRLDGRAARSSGRSATIRATDPFAQPPHADAVPVPASRIQAAPGHATAAAWRKSVYEDWLADPRIIIAVAAA